MPIFHSDNGGAEAKLVYVPQYIAVICNELHPYTTVENTNQNCQFLCEIWKLGTSTDYTV